LLILFLLGFITVVNTQQKPKTDQTPKVEIYYFHPKERCPIDLSIEENTRTVMQSHFSGKIKDGTIKFQVLNTDDKANAKTAARFTINAQALYIVKHGKDKETKTDLTDFAFSTCYGNPAKFNARLKDEIETALK